LQKILSQEFNLIATGYQILAAHAIDAKHREETLLMKQRGIIRKIIDSNSRICGMAMNSLKAWLAHCLLLDEANKGIANMRNGMLDKLFKTREGHERRQFQSAFERMIKWNQLCNTKQAIIKNMFRKMLGKNDSVLMHAYNHLTENCHVKRTFTKCKSLFRALEISDRCIDNTYRLYYRLLVTFKHVNPWLLRVVNAVTKNAKVDPQIAFWRLKDMRTKGTALNAARIVRLRKMFEIINKHYVMQIARSFWKIDRCLDLDQTMNSSFYYAQRAMQQGMGSDMMSQTNMQSRADLRSKGDPSRGYGDDLNFKSPDREVKGIRQTSPRAKYGAGQQQPQRAVGRGLLGIMGKR